jgi:hypothetical protein
VDRNQQATRAAGEARNTMRAIHPGYALPCGSAPDSPPSDHLTGDQTLSLQGVASASWCVITLTSTA